MFILLSLFHSNHPINSCYIQRKHRFTISITFSCSSFVILLSQVRGEQESLFAHEPGKSCPEEILGALAAFGAEGRPLWKPMHMQPVYRMSPFAHREPLKSLLVSGIDCFFLPNMFFKVRELSPHHWLFPSIRMCGLWCLRICMVCREKSMRYGK